MKARWPQEWHTGQCHPCQAQCRAHPQLMEASRNLVHWSWAPQIHHYTWVRFTLESHGHVSMAAYSTCKNQQSAKEWIALWLIWSRQVQTTVLQKQWTQENICCVSLSTSKTFSNAKIQEWALCQDTEAFYSLAEPQIKQIKLCILPASTHSFPNYQETLIVASSLVTWRGTVFCRLI